MNHELQMDSTDLKIAIELFSPPNSYGIGTVRRKLHERTGRWFSEPQIRRRLKAAGYYRNNEQAYEAKRKPKNNSIYQNEIEGIEGNDNGQQT